MYLPSFFKYRFEKYAFNAKRAAPFTIPLAIWIGWMFYPQFYNTIFTDFFPPPRGVQRRIVEDI